MHTGEESLSQVQFGHISSALQIFPPFYHDQVFINFVLLNALIVSDKVVHMSFLTQRVGPLENLAQILFLHFGQRSYVVASLHEHTW